MSCRSVVLGVVRYCTIEAVSRVEGCKYFFFCGALYCWLCNGVYVVNYWMCESVVVYLSQRAFVWSIVALLMIVIGEFLWSKCV